MKVNEHFISIYEYTGRSAGVNNIGKEINDAARKNGIQVIWRDLPEEIKRDNYTKVATYPKSFLDKYFGNDVKYTVIADATISMLFEKLTALEEKFDKIIKNSDIKQEEDDDLPF